MDGLADQLWAREADQLLEKCLDDLRFPDLEGICGIADQLLEKELAVPRVPDLVEGRYGIADQFLEKDLAAPRVPDLVEGMDGTAGRLWGVVLPNRESA